jgi:hypothetical protein
MVNCQLFSEKHINTGVFISLRKIIYVNNLVVQNTFV